MLFYSYFCDSWFSVHSQEDWGDCFFLTMPNSSYHSKCSVSVTGGMVGGAGSQLWGRSMSFRSPSACPLLTGPAGEVLGIDIPLDSLGFQLNSDFSLSPRAAAKISDGSQYYVLLIITDGVISDMTQTKEAIVSVSLRRVWQEEVTVNNCPGVEILPYVQANKSGCQFHGCSQWTQDFWIKSKGEIGRASCRERV